jgi:hypothetical protein
VLIFFYLPLVAAAKAKKKRKKEKKYLKTAPSTELNDE